MKSSSFGFGGIQGRSQEFLTVGIKSTFFLLFFCSFYDVTPGHLMLRSMYFCMYVCIFDSIQIFFYYAFTSPLHVYFFIPDGGGGGDNSHFPPFLSLQIPSFFPDGGGGHSPMTPPPPPLATPLATGLKAKV
jgi:hypothetical protein